MKIVKIALIGATGIVGQEILNQFAERSGYQIYALASQSSVGRSVAFGEETLTVAWAETFDFELVDIVIIAAGAKLAEAIVPKAKAAGCWIIDKSSAYRLKSDVPLVIAKVNGYLIEQMQAPGLIASPNCTVTPLAIALHPLLDYYPLTRVNVATYQSVSGSGHAGIEALFSQSCAHLNTKPLPEHDVYDGPMAFNCRPMVGQLLDNGYSDEEMKMHHECQKLLALPALVVNATAVRVPVFCGHALAVHATFENNVDLAHVHELWQEAELSVSQAPTPLEDAAAGQDEVVVGRVRLDLASPNQLNFWLVADNLRIGAASNSVAIVDIIARVHINREEIANV